MKTRNIYNKDKVFFTSDLHFFHKAIIHMAGRPFNDIEDMQKKLIYNWNSVIGEDDNVFILGDFAFTGNIDVIKSLLDSLNGKKHLIFGNHDIHNKYKRQAVMLLFESANDYLEILINEGDYGQLIVLSHYPFLVWNQQRHKSWNLFGHIHSGPNSSSSDNDIALSQYQYDVGIDNNNYFPISYLEIKEKFSINT